MHPKAEQLSSGAVGTIAGSWSRRETIGWAVAFGLLTILVHLPFLFRYDLYFQSGIAPAT